jgi:hypothetical protein
VWAPQTCVLLIFVVGSFGLNSVLLSKRSILEDLGVTSLVVIGEGGRMTRVTGGPVTYATETSRNFQIVIGNSISNSRSRGNTDVQRRLTATRKFQIITVG